MKRRLELIEQRKNSENISVCTAHSTHTYNFPFLENFGKLQFKLESSYYKIQVYQKTWFFIHKLFPLFQPPNSALNSEKSEILECHKAEPQRQKFMFLEIF